MSVWRQMNVLCKHGGRRVKSFPLEVKLLEKSKRTPTVCAVFIVSSNHQYSTFQNEMTWNTKLLLNRRLLASNITSYGLLSTDNASKVQGIHVDTASRNYYATEEVPGGSVTKSPSGDAPADLGVSSTELSASDHAESVLSSENLSENLALTPDVTSVLDNAEVPLSALGLAGWTPVGLIQWSIELLHVHLNIPWWAAIVTATFIARVCLFPLMIKAQKNAAELSNYMPQLQVLQQNFQKARCSGDTIQASKCGMEVHMFMQKHKINPFKPFVIPLLQAPVFISFFLGLRSMANLPVESFKTGGIWWLTDLTIPDPYYITPALTCATLYVILKVGADGGMRMEHMKMAKYAFMALPVILLPVTANFPMKKVQTLKKHLYSVFLYAVTLLSLDIPPITQLNLLYDHKARSLPKSPEQFMYYFKMFCMLLLIFLSLWTVIPYELLAASAVLCYWFANNVFTLGTVSLLRIESVRKACKIPERKPLDPQFKLPKKGFIEGVKEAYQDQKILGAMADRDRIDAIRFRKAGAGPVPRTYSYDPTKPRPAAAARKAQAKEYKP